MSKTTIDISQYKFDDTKKISRAFSKSLTATQLKGLQMNPDNTPANPDVLASNLDCIKDLLVQFYYNITDTDSLDSEVFNELYKPIEKLDPMGLTKAGK